MKLLLQLMVIYHLVFMKFLHIEIIQSQVQVVHLLCLPRAAPGLHHGPSLGATRAR